MKILAVDYGESRTGLAICDATEMLTRAITPQIEEKSMNKVAEAVVEAAKANGAEKIVVGLCKNMDGTEGSQAKKCAVLRAKLPICGAVSLSCGMNAKPRFRQRLF